MVYGAQNHLDHWKVMWPWARLYAWMRLTSTAIKRRSLDDKHKESLILSNMHVVGWNEWCSMEFFKHSLRIQASTETGVSLAINTYPPWQMIVWMWSKKIWRQCFFSNVGLKSHCPRFLPVFLLDLGEVVNSFWVSSQLWTSRRFSCHEKLRDISSKIKSMSCDQTSCAWLVGLGPTTLHSNASILQTF